MRKLKLYLIWQQTNNDYDTYDSAIVCAIDKEDAKTIFPGGGDYELDEDGRFFSEYENGSKYYPDNWVNMKDIKVEYIGVAKVGLKRGSILGSFNAG